GKRHHRDSARPGLAARRRTRSGAEGPRTHRAGVAARRRRRPEARGHSRAPAQEGRRRRQGPGAPRAGGHLRGKTAHPGGRVVAIFGEDRHVRGAERCQLYTVAFSPNGKRLAFGGTGNAVRLIDLEGRPPREQTWKQRGPEAIVESLAFSPDGKLLACAKANG